MTQQVLLKRSSVQGKVPTTGDLALGEVAINTYDGRFFFAKSDGTTTSIVELLSDTNSTLDSLSDVVITDPAYPHVLTYNGVYWENAGLRLDELSDVTNPEKGTGDVLTWDGVNMNWTVSTPGTLINDDTTTNADFYPMLSPVSFGSPITSATVSSTELSFNPSTGTLSAIIFSGSGASLTNLNASNLSTGTVNTARLGSGSASSSTYLRGDGTWATIVSGATIANDTTTNATYYPTFSTTTSGSLTTATISSSKLTYNPSTGVLAATGFSGSGASLTSLTAGNLSGTIPSAVLGNSTHYVGTTAVALNRASANQALTGILSVALPGATSGTITLTPAAVAGTTAITIPATAGTLVTTGDSATVTNTMLSGSIANAKLTNSSVTVGTTAISLGASATTIAGLTSVSSTGFTGALTGNASSASTVAVTDTNTAGTYYIPFTSSSSGNATLNVDATTTPLSYNPNTGVLTASGFSGPITGAASQISVTTTDANATYYPTIVTGVGSGITLYADNTTTPFFYNPNLGTMTVPGTLTVSGDLVVNGTTTTLNSTTLTVDDKNIELGSVTTPTDTTADGGGITLKGATNKTINWIASTGAWTFSEDLNLVTTKSFKIAGTSVLSSTTLGSSVVSSSLTSVGTITSGTWSGSFGAVSGANLTSLTAGNLSGTIPSAVLGNSTVYIGTTAVALNRASGALVLTGITSIDGNAATATTATKSTNLVGGNSTTLLGSIGYQSNTDTTTLLGPNTTATKKFLTQTGTGTNGAAPAWGTIAMADLGSSPTASTYLRGDGTWQTISTGTSVTLANDTTTNATYYPAFATASSGTLSTLDVSSTKLTYNPSTGVLTSVDYNSLSDQTLKENIISLTNSIDVINQINPVKFDWKDSGKSAYGVIAQEIEQILPEIVNTNNEGIKSVSYTQIIALLVDAVKQLSSEIEILKNK